MKVLYISPHLSTGGCPQYLLKKIIELNNSCEIYCIEYSDITGGVLTVQRNQIASILGNRLITLDDNKNELVTHIENIKPDVIHFEELPEYFCDQNVASKIYTKDRKYKIIETSHDSSFNPKNKLFFPDHFVFVSKYQSDLFKELNIPYDVIEYPIEYKKKQNRLESLINLGLDPEKTHILNIGLFTPRKNQLEIINYAKMLLEAPVQFHFVGNQADNFKSYWEPMMKNFPSNCKWWGERKDVDSFYNAMDLFLFTSKGTDRDKETNPIVIREAIGWGLPILMYNLPVYCGMYDKYEKITWLKDNFEENLNLIKSKIINNSNFINFDELFDVDFESESNKFNIHYKKEESNFYSVVFKDIDSNASMYYFNSVFANYINIWAIPIPKHAYSFIDQPSLRGVKIEIYNKEKKLISYKDLFIKNVPKIRNFVLDTIDPFDCLFNNYNEMFVHNRYDCFQFENYLDVVLDVGANSGLFTKLCLQKGAKKIFSIEPNEKCLNNLKHITRNDKNVIIVDKAISDKRKKVKFYVTDDNSTIGSMFKTHTGREHSVREIDVECITIDDIINDYNLSKITMLKLDVEAAEYEILCSLGESTFKKIDSILVEYHDNEDRRVISLVNHLEKFGYKISVVQNQASHIKEDLKEKYVDFANGTIFFTKNHIEPLKIKLVHLQTKLNDDREIASRKSLESLKDYGIDYVLHTNELYSSLPPIHTCRRPNDVSMEKKHNDSLTPAHYGCFESFKLGILSEFDNDLDYLILCEGDCFLEIDPVNLTKTIKDVDEILKRENIDYFSFGDKNTLDTGILQSNIVYKPENQDLCYVTDRIIGLQCIMFSKRIRKTLFEYLRTAKWDAADIYFNLFSWEKNIKRGILNNRVTTQCDGPSILDKTYKIFNK